MFKTISVQEALIQSLVVRELGSQMLCGTSICIQPSLYMGLNSPVQLPCLDF